MLTRWLIGCWLSLWLGGTGAAPAAMPPDASVDFAEQIRPLLADRCFHCHGPDPETREAGLRLDQREAALSLLDSGTRAVVPGQPGQSELLVRVLAEDEDLRMPPVDGGEALQPAEIEWLRQWIAQGAVYQQHWSFASLQPVPIPDVNCRNRWTRTAVDAFVLRRLQTIGLEPSAEAERNTLLRRVTLHLTGLPPTPQDVRAFVDDRSPGAYERCVDRLLQSPAFGEHWARDVVGPGPLRRLRRLCPRPTAQSSGGIAIG